MIISKNRVVSLAYLLRLGDGKGEVMETASDSRPLMFIFGTGSMLPGFERRIENLKTGDSFAFLLKCEEAYGPAQEDAIMEIPKTNFAIDGEIDDDMLVVGNSIPMTDADGNRWNGIVVEVRDDSVLLDLNHPLAGDDLFFSGTVVGVRKATVEELERGYVSGCSPDGCDGCNGGCH